MTAVDLTLDTRGERCPIPVIRLAKAARQLRVGTIELLADDVATRSDVPAWCRLKSAELLQTTTSDAETMNYRFLIRVDDSTE